MNNWRTTLCGVIVLVGSTIGQFWPELAKLSGFLCQLGAGLGLLIAQDSRKRRPALPADSSHPNPHGQA